MNKSCHFWNAKLWAQTFASIVSFNLPRKLVRIGIIPFILQTRKVLLREMKRVPKVTRWTDGRAGTQLMST